MSITETGGFVKYITAGKSDRGGSSMNLIRRILANLNQDDKKGRYKTEAINNINDYGYALYQSLEYSITYLKNDDSGLKGNVTNIIIR
ncbi:MAG: hypothetical protein APF77_23150 [Clostridia bacterium BRH_c25]|nr:MAG: hypothetical protein APF77_23150 [Clostridia bacterium BRH_c25]